MRRAVVVLLLVPALAGCIGALPQETAAPDTSSIEDVLDLRDDGGVRVQVPVDVVLVGFDDGVADRLRSRLDPEPVDHAALDFFRTFPPDPDQPRTPLSFRTHRLPTEPVARYRVHDAPDAFRDRLYRFAQDDARVNATAYDANAVEDWLADNLPGIGVPMDEDRPVLVLIHGRDALGDHAYRYEYANGWLGPVRVFGERAPLVAMDLSARPDPWVLARQEPKVYDEPVPAAGDGTVEALTRATIDATHFRLLQGAIYPIATEECHAVTLILGIRQTAATEVLPGYRRAEEMVDTGRLESGWENATGADTVHVDVQVLDLPQDDPALASLSRGSLATLDAFRWWLDANWEDYWVAHDGCEPYVSFLVFGDVAEPLSFGIATYDTEKSHRISFSAAGERSRIRDMYRGPAEDTVNDRPDSRDAYDWVNLLYAHETGHLLGQRHPQDITTTQGGRGTWSFNSVHSAMAYQTGDRTVDFGAVDRANFQRNRAGYVIQQAREQGLQDTPAFEQALSHLRSYEWQEVYETLGPKLER